MDDPPVRQEEPTPADVGSRPALLHVITTTDRRGAEVFGVDLSAELARRGWESECVALVEGAEDARLVTEVLGRRRRGPSTLWRLRRRAGGRLVVAHGSTTLAACSLALGRRRPFVYRNIGDPGYWAPTRSRALRLRRFLRSAGAVVALTEGTAAALHDRFGVPRAAIRVIPRGIPAGRFPPVDDARRREARVSLGLPADGPVAVYLGALAPEKNVGLALEAVGLLPEVTLVVAGDGPDRANLARRAAGLAPGRVVFTGSVPDPARILAAADVAVLPSATEGLPGVLIEAGLSGLPAVATAVGEVATIVRHGETGFLVPPGDGAAFAAAAETALERRVALGAAAREHCLGHFELGRVADAWEELLATVGARRAGAGAGSPAHYGDG